MDAEDVHPAAEPLSLLPVPALTPERAVPAPQPRAAAGRFTAAPGVPARAHGVVLGAIAGIAGLVPLLVAAPAPLMDWPSHLARVWITGRVLAGDAFWMERYAFHGFLIPNAVLDLGVLGLMRLGLGVATAGTVFLLLLYTAFVGGACRLATRIGSASVLTLPIAVTCFYSTLLFYGLVNFVAGLAAMLWALSVWCDLAERPRRRAIVAIAATAAIALCHIVAAIVFIGVAACLDLPGLLRNRSRWAARIAPCAAAVLVLAAVLALSPVETGGTGTIGYNSGGTLSGLLWRKAVILARAMSSGQLGPDVVMGMIAAVLAGVAYRVRARIAWPWALAAGGLLCLSFAASDVVGEGAFLDARLVPAAVLLAAVSVPLHRAGRPTAALLVGLVVLRLGWLSVDWHRAGQSHLALDAALARLPRGSILLAGSGTEGSALTWAEEWSPPAGNIASLAVMHGIFVPSVFASRSQQPLALREEWREWRHYQDVSTPAQLRAVLNQQPDCRRYGPISILVLHARDNELEPLPPSTVMGPPGFPFALVPVC